MKNASRIILFALWVVLNSLSSDILCQSITSISTTISCINSPTGSIEITIDRAEFEPLYNLPIDVDWTNLESGSVGSATLTGYGGSIVNVSGGNYILIFDVSENCELTTQTFVATYNDFDVVLTVSDAMHLGCQDGQIDLSVSGGSGKFEYIWSNGQTSEDLIDIAPGAYSVTITDQVCGNSIIKSTKVGGWRDMGIGSFENI